MSSATAPVPSPSDPISQPAISQPRNPSWLACLIATILACAVSAIGVEIARGPLEVPLPKDLMSDDSNTDKLHAAVLDNTKTNLRYLLTILAAALPAVFGLTIGIRSGGIVRGILAAVIGGSIGAAAAWFLSPNIAVFAQELKMSTWEPLERGLMIHGLSWGMILFGIGVAVAIAVASVAWGIRSFVMLAIGGALGLVLAVILGSFLEQLNNMEDVIITSPSSLALWAVAPVACAGLLLTWGAFRAPTSASETPAKVS